MIKTIAKVGALCAASLCAVSAIAFYDTQILIDRALNSPTLTVRYSGARAALVELRLNGVSLGTRTVSSAKTAGETSFNLDLSTLSDGDNDVEVRIYDKAGKLLGSERTLIASDDGSNAPVRMTNPKMGATVQGAVEIKVGFGRELKNVYVSFFVDNQFKSMSNVAPFTFVWDTTREANGWHELEAMLVDDASATFKTRKVRVLVNNPSGRTERQPTAATQGTIATPKTNASAVPIKSSPRTGTIPTTMANAVSTTSAPPLKGATVANPIHATTGGKVGVKQGSLGASQPAGARVLTPTLPNGTAPKSATQAQKTGTIQIRPAANGANAAATATVGAPKLTINKGTKLPNVGTFSISLNSKLIEFDVQPRVQDGIALAPIRHLLEGAGGEVSWEHQKKIVNALAEGKTIRLKVGDRFAVVGDERLELELSPFIEKGRTIIPLSFIKDTLKVEVEYDPATGHVLITSKK